MTVTVWTVPISSGAAGISVPVSTPVVYADADSADAVAGVLTVKRNGQTVALWGDAAWQRAEIH